MTVTSRGTMPPIFRGIALIARGRAQGLNCFRDSPQAFLISLTPGLGILAGAVIEGLVEGGGIRTFDQVPGALCVLLTPSVISYELARFLGREAFWYRYIVAFNWCQWLVPVLGFLIVVGFTVLRNAGIAGQDLLRL